MTNRRDFLKNLAQFTGVATLGA
ncbi:twin-arginine translocation signal domain-containing protein, partial [Helicobacter typhlonius]